MLKFLSLILGCLLVMGCASGDSPVPKRPAVCTPGSVYDVRIDPNLPQGWKDGIRAAFTSWSEVLNGSFKASFREVDPRTVAWNNPCAISWFSGAKGGHWGEMASDNGHDRFPDWGVVYVKEDAGINSDGVEYATALHEVGHILGLDHNDDPDDNSVMWRFITVPGRLSCSDVQKASAIWGSAPPDCEKGEYVR